MAGSSRPTWAKWATRVVLVFAVIALAWTINDIGLSALGYYFQRIGWWWIMVVVLEVLNTILDATAIRAFTSPEQAKLKLRHALMSQLAGRAVNVVTPSGNLGELVKASVLTDFVSESRAVATILLYNIVSFAVELAMVAVAVPFLVLLVPMPAGLVWMMIATGAVCLAIATGLILLVRRGMLASFARLAVRLRLLSKARHARWEHKLASVDDKLRLVSGARTRDRWIGIAAITASRTSSMVLSLLILHAVGLDITLSFLAAYIVGGFAVYMVSSLIPMGIGVSEGGWYGLFRALGENPAHGVTLVLARRTTLVVYAAVGIVLVTASETVKRAREKAAAKDAGEVVTAAAVEPSAELAAEAPVGLVATKVDG